MYIPNSKIRRKITTDSITFVSKNKKTPYKGPYIETTNGKFYAGHDNTRVGFELEKISPKYSTATFKKFGLSKGTRKYNIINKGVKAQLQHTNTPSTFKPSPTEIEYNKGFMIRYFFKRINGNLFQETNKTVYDSIYKRENKYDYNLYEIGSLRWYITGTDVHALNAQILKKAELLYPNITYLFPILNEHLRADEKGKENLITPGGELYYASGKEYVGPYHIHPTKGPMVGAFHVDRAHEVLYYFKQLPKTTNANYNFFIKNYDKIQCYKCIGSKLGNKIVSTKISSFVGCPENTYSTYEEAVDACPSKENTPTLLKEERTDISNISRINPPSSPSNNENETSSNGGGTSGGGGGGY